MAVIYYPNGSSMLTRNVEGTNYTQQFLEVNPNSILFFDGTSNLTSSVINLTASLALTASYVSSIMSSSYALTSSYALNGGSGGGASISSSWASQSLSSSYLINSNISQLYIITASIGTIPINLSIPEQLLNITASTNISFSIVSASTANIVQDSLISIYNTSPTITGLYFPTTWIGLGGAMPLQLTASKSAIMLFRSVNNSLVYSSFNVQL